MDYAIIDNGVVVNIIRLAMKNAHERPDAVLIDRFPVWIGDTYLDGRFYRNGELLESYEVIAQQVAQAMLLDEMEAAYREGVNAV